uniref:Uncharacterized protein n=1 Tax=Anguilla anguilla TaxID=7936 RepID=A0A0E9VVJ6_ANGAN
MLRLLYLHRQFFHSFYSNNLTHCISHAFLWHHAICCPGNRINTNCFLLL